MSFCYAAWNRPPADAADDHLPFARMYIQMYADGWVFSWDERKSAANLAERGFDFEFASLIFAGPKERSAYEAAVKAGKAQSRPRGP